MKICFDRILPRDLHRYNAMPAASLAVARLAATITKQWPNGTTLRVKFMGGTAAQQDLARRVMPEWSQYANINFVFGTDPASEIRVNFIEGDGAWSYIGQDCLDIPRDSHTMNLGWAKTDADRGMILHETGHCLGAIHEHESPAGGILWNKPQVYKDLEGPPNNWDQNTIDANMFEKYDAGETNFTVMDPTSIMMYAFPASWTLDGWHTVANNELSAQDKAFIGSAKMYPKPSVPVTPVADNILPVSFVVERAASIAKPGEEDLYQMTVTTPGPHVIQTHGDTDCLMAIYGPNSGTALIAKDDDSGVGHNAWLQLDLKAGLYQVSVRHFSKSKTGAYRVSATRT